MAKKVHPVQTCPKSGRRFKIYKGGVKKYLCEHDTIPTRCRKGKCILRFTIDKTKEKCPCGSGVTLRNCRKCDSPGSGRNYCTRTNKHKVFCRCGDTNCGSRICKHEKRIHLCHLCSPVSHLLDNVRSRINGILAKGRKTNTTAKYLGCSSKVFYEHIQASFQPGMSWENRGEWEIGHRKPLREEGITEEETIERLHYTNTFAQWKEDNMEQGNRYHFAEY